MEDEGVGDIHAGIGRECKELTELRASYLEGLHSIDLGLRYRHQDHVFVYEKQMIERIVDLIPQEKKSDILQMFFKDASEDLLSDEIQTTVRVFFQNDLNLTAASKQLFIHRNTLNYRLDKIKKDFGLDLRSFQDAVVFRIISEIANEI
jgi:carbohydrate diacid regulator